MRTQFQRIRDYTLSHKLDLTLCLIIISAAGWAIYTR
jgi:hypothetical protein